MLFCGLNSCKSTDKTVITAKKEAPGLSEVKWKMVSFKGKEVNAGDIESQISIHINEEAKTISGYSGCNQYFGDITIFEPERIRFEKIGSTKRACPQNNMQIEKTYLNSLDKINGYKVSQTELQLLQNEKVLYIFEKE